MEEEQESLDELQARLAKAAADGSPQAEEMLAHVEQYRKTPQPTEEDHRTLSDRLSDSLRHFEASHPDLSATMQAVINSFTASGM